MFRNTAYLCQFTHTYSLWKNHINGDLIDLGEFSKRNENPPLIEGFPEHLPIYFNEETGEIVA